MAKPTYKFWVYDIVIDGVVVYVGQTSEPKARFAIGALTELEAEEKCKPSSDQTGEVSCAGQFEHGFSIVVTAASLKALDDWCEREMKRLGL